MIVKSSWQLGVMAKFAPLFSSFSFCCKSVGCEVINRGVDNFFEKKWKSVGNCGE